jgi:flagellar hook protein FlgE
LGPIKGQGGNMASGDVKATVTQPLQVYDAFGEVHTLQVTFLKIAPNTWATEVFVPEADQVITTQTTHGQVASGIITFTGSGALHTVSSTLSNVIEIDWTNSSDKSQIKINWGDLSQVVGESSASYTKDGAAPGKLASTIFDQNGYVIAKFTNGDSRKIFQLPLASFPNVDGLKDNGGNAYSKTNVSGDLTLAKVGSAGVGSIVPNSLEGSNVDLSEQLTNAITCQRTYQSCSRMIKVYDEMLEELGRIIT